MTISQRLRSFFLLTLGLFFLAGCSEVQLATHWAKQVTWPGQAESQGSYKVGTPYKVGSVWYYPEENFKLVETGIASWYGPGFHAANTANGEVFDQTELTAAHRTLQMPSLVRVTNLENGRSVVLRVNDRGPFKHGRILDVSMRAAQLLGFADKGTARIRLQVLEKESRIIASAAKNGEDTTRLTMADLQSRRVAENKRLVPAPVTDKSYATPSRPLYKRTIEPQVAAKAPQQKRHVRMVNEGDADLPESLQTPTITVEPLNEVSTLSKLKPLDEIQPLSLSRSKVARKEMAPIKMAEGRLDKGRFMPAPVVSMAPIRPTGLFIQAASFSVYDNAERLAKKMESIAPTLIEPVKIQARTMYRVKLGPIASLQDADNVLERVIHAGFDTARVVKAKQ